MNYYKRHLGDYAKNTKHLSLAEHGVLTVLLDYYYATEKPIPDDRCERIANAHADYELTAVRSVLSEFFTLTAKGWINRRADQVIGEFEAKSLKAKESSEARWRQVECERNANASKTHNQRNASHKPLATSQEGRALPEGSKDPSSSALSATDQARVDAAAEAEVKAKKSNARLAEVTDEASAAYNETCAKPNGLLSPVTKPGRKTRMANVKRILETASDICQELFHDKRITRKFWDGYFGTIQADEHKSGRLGGGKGHETWLPDFEYLTRRDTMIDVFEKSGAGSTE